MADQTLPQPVIDMLASRFHRFHHHTWHIVRDNWYLLTDDDRKAIADLHWAPNGERGSWYLSTWDQRKTGRIATTNGSGEDFMFFHRQMIASVRMMVEENGGTWASWATIPAPAKGDRVPATWQVISSNDISSPVDETVTRSLATIKSDAFYFAEMALLQRQFRDPCYLQRITLGELGSLVEWSVHNQMHIRWSAMPWNPDTGRHDPIPGRDDAALRVDAKWDDPKNDELNDTYSAPVNPVFWKLHQWVDDRIEDWAEANARAIKRKTVGGVDWFDVCGGVGVSDPWTGAFPTTHHNGGMGDEQKLLAEMEKTFEIVTTRVYAPTKSIQKASSHAAGGLAKRLRFMTH